MMERHTLLGGTKFRYRAEQDPQFELGQEVELVELICNTRPYLVMSKENQEKAGA